MHASFNVEQTAESHMKFLCQVMLKNPFQANNVKLKNIFRIVGIIFKFNFLPNVHRNYICISVCFKQKTFTNWYCPNFSFSNFITN